MASASKGTLTALRICPVGSVVHNTASREHIACGSVHCTYRVRVSWLVHERCMSCYFKPRDVLGRGGHERVRQPETVDQRLLVHHDE